MSIPHTIQVALADDHVLLRKALASLINGFADCRVACEASNGSELLSHLQKGLAVDLVILDLNMPEMDGFETAAWLASNRPEIPVIMLTMYDSELSLIRLLQSGVRGFLKKDSHPDELRQAIQSIRQTGYYYSHHITGKLVNLFRSKPETGPALQNILLNEQELRFLELACSDLTYKEIALAMGLNPRQVDGLRDQLFIKLDVKSRVGLAIVTIRNGLVRF